jgi:predicted nucleic acid-binding protein
MSDKRITLDTNILVYAMDRQSDERHGLAHRLVARAPFVDCWLTLQSISEFYAVVSRKRMVSVSEAAAQANDWLTMFPTVGVSASAIRAALTTASAGIVSYWDALLVATAAEAGCTTILTEDLSDGTTLYGVRILNPFAGTSLSADAETLLSID